MRENRRIKIILLVAMVALVGILVGRGCFARWLERALYEQPEKQ